MKPEQLAETRGVFVAIAPGEVQVPHKVVQQCEFDGCCRRIKVVPRRQPVEQTQRRKLEYHADRSHQVELTPAYERFHDNGSWRYNSAVWRMVMPMAIANIPAAAIAPPTSNSSSLCPNN